MNRKTRRWMAAIARRHFDPPSQTTYHWHRRFLNEMRQCQRVIKLVADGLADKWLER